MDEIDRKRALKLSWVYAPPERPLTLSDEPEGFAPEDAPDREERRVNARLQVARLADAVRRAWLLPAEEQPKAVLLLARMLREMDLMALVTMREHPREAVRLARLIVRHRALLDDQEVPLLSPFLPLAEHPESAALIFEVAQSGDASLLLSLRLSLGDRRGELRRRFPELGRRLLALLEPGVSLGSRKIALELLTWAPWPEAVGPLRRMLREPLVSIREPALTALLAFSPPALEPEDVLWLLEDAVANPLPPTFDERSDDCFRYQEALGEAVVRLRPEGGWRPLARIAEGDCEVIHATRHFLAEEWALTHLAAAYPERALPHVDAALASTRSFTRRRGALAAAKLPNELALPRLVAASCDPHSLTAEASRDGYAELTGTLLLVKPTDGFCTGLLAGPPSEDFLRRALLLRGGSDEAKRAIIKLLLSEAPHREALVLLLFALGDAQLMAVEEHLPSSRGEWAERLLSAFGEPAIEGMLWHDERQSHPDMASCWLGALGREALEGLSPRAKVKVRARAAARLGSTHAGARREALDVLATLGTPRRALERLWELAIEARSEDFFEGARARDALARARARGLDRRLEEAMRESLDDGRLDRFASAGEVALRRQSAPAAALVEQIAAAVTDPSLASALAELTHWMPRGPVARWVFDALFEHASPRFEIAARLVLRHQEVLSPEVWRALEVALEAAVPAAAEIALTLLCRDELERDDPRLEAILRAAPVHAKAELLNQLLWRGRPAVALEQHLLTVICSEHVESALELVDGLGCCEDVGAVAVLRKAHRSSVAPEVAREIEGWLKLPTPAERYWRDLREDGAPA